MSALLSRPREWTVDGLHAALGALEAEAGDDIDYRRFEIVDGTLVMSPSAGSRHEILILRLAARLGPRLPGGVVLAPSVGVDLGASYVVPDLVMVPASRFNDDTTRLPPAEVSMVVEVVSPGSTTMDRVTKPALYAAAGIRHYWRVETRPVVTVIAYALGDGGYREVGIWGPGETMTVEEPFPVTLSLDELNQTN